MEEAYKVLEEKKLLVDSEGAQIVDLEAFKLGKTVIRNRLGATLYLTRDVSAAKSRWEKYAVLLLGTQPIQSYNLVP